MVSGDANNRTGLSKFDTKCEVIDEELNVIKIIVKDSNASLYSIEVLETVGCDTDTLLHIDRKEIVASLATSAKSAEDFYYNCTIHDRDDTKYCFIGTKVVRKHSTVYQDHANKLNGGEIIADSVDLELLLCQDKQGILYSVQIELKVDRELDNILDDACRAKLAELIAALGKSGKSEHLSEVGDSQAYSRVTTRFVTEHSLEKLEAW